MSAIRLWIFWTFVLVFCQLLLQFFLPAHRKLCLAQRVLMSSEAIDWLIVCAIAQGGKARYPHINTDRTSRCRYRSGYFLFCLNRYVPFASSLADGDILDLAGNVPAFPVAYPSYLRQVYPAVSLFQFDALRIANTVPDTFAFESGKVCSFGEEVPVRRFKVFQALLEYLTMTAL